MRDISFGQYYPSNSFLHKLDPRFKLIFVVLFVVTIFLAKRLYGFVFIALFLILAILVSKVPVKSILKTLKGILFIVIFTAILNIFFVRSGEVLYQSSKVGWFMITRGGVEMAIKLMLRIILLVIGTSLLTYTTTPMALTDGLESLMSPLKKIKVPVHDIAIIMNISLRFIPILMEEVDKIMNAQKARGAAFDNGGLIKRAKALLPVLIPLFVSAFRRAEELALALDARCYNATPNRTKYKKIVSTWRDLVASLFMIGLLVMVIVINNNFWINLIPAQYFY